MPAHTGSGHRPLVFPLVAPYLLTVATLSGATTLTDISSQLQKLDPGGAHRDVTLPNVADGWWFWFVNAADAAENLVIKNSAAATIVTVNQNEEAIVMRQGGAWVLVRVATIALS